MLIFLNIFQDRRSRSRSRDRDRDRDRNRDRDRDRDRDSYRRDRTPERYLYDSIR